MLQQHGASYTLTRATATPASASPWKQAAAISTAYTVYGVLADYTTMERATMKLETTDRRYLIAASGLSVVPQPGDTLTDGGTLMVVVEVETAARYQTTDILYYLRVRR